MKMSTNLVPYNPYEDTLMQRMNLPELLADISLDVGKLDEVKADFEGVRREPERLWQEQSWWYRLGGRLFGYKDRFLARQPRTAVYDLYEAQVRVGETLLELNQYLSDIVDSFNDIREEWDENVRKEGEISDNLIVTNNFNFFAESELKALDQYISALQDYDVLTDEEKDDLSKSLQGLHDGFIPNISSSEVCDYLVEFLTQSEASIKGKLYGYLAKKDVLEIQKQSAIERYMNLREDALQLSKLLVTGLKYATKLSAQFNALDRGKKRKHLAQNIIGTIGRAIELCDETSALRKRSRVATAEQLDDLRTLERFYAEVDKDPLEKEFDELENGTQ